MTYAATPGPAFERVGPYRYRIPRHGAMRGDAVFYASDAVLRMLEEEGFASLQQLVNVATLPGLVAPALAMPDLHWGYGFPIGGVAAFDPARGGVVSPGGVGYDINCGVRLLATSLDEDELHPRIERLADALFRRVPTGVGSKRAVEELKESELEQLLVDGAAWMVAHGRGEENDLEHTESGGRLLGADPDQLSPRARMRGLPQLGTLGSGNHFLEVQVVDEVYDVAAADAMGLSVGSVTVLIHTGSRGLGHQVCSEFVERFLNALPRFDLDLADRQLAAAPVDSPEGRAYLGAMRAAANFAFANRQRITHSVRQAFEDVGLTPRDHGLRVVYDVAHNHARLEEHGGRALLVHRKGATRAFPPGHPEVPAAYREVGQPVFVPGDMGRASYVLVGTEGAMRDSFGSTCHGAGRRLSRHRARKEGRHRDLREELRRHGVVVRAQSPATLAEEMPEAYKDVTDVVDTVHRAGIGRKVARLRPRVVVKG